MLKISLHDNNFDDILDIIESFKIDYELDNQGNILIDNLRIKEQEESHPHHQALSAILKESSNYIINEDKLNR